MSAKRLGDTAIVRRMSSEAVAWFREARLHPDNADKDIWELARECANGAFQNNALMIPTARREIVARKFMDECRLVFALEVRKALAEVSNVETLIAETAH